MKLYSNKDGKQVVDFGDAVSPDGKLIQPTLRGETKKELWEFYKDFGLTGAITFVAGGLLLGGGLVLGSTQDKAINAFTGLALMAIAAFISFIRSKSQSLRDRYISETTQASVRAVAETLVGVTDHHRINATLQKARQIHDHGLQAMANQPVSEK